MLYDLYVFLHNVLNMCFWTLPALICGAAMIVIAFMHMNKQKEREENFEEELVKKLTAPSTEDAAV